MTHGTPNSGAPLTLLSATRVEILFRRPSRALPHRRLLTACHANEALVSALLDRVKWTGGNLIGGLIQIELPAGFCYILDVS
ncbi:hypothetical protein VTH06DRAFT_3032 [Thermothelomyces fergusii]